MLRHQCPGGCFGSAPADWASCGPCWLRLPLRLRDGLARAARLGEREAIRAARVAARAWWQANPAWLAVKASGGAVPHLAAARRVQTDGTHVTGPMACGLYLSGRRHSAEGVCPQCLAAVAALLTATETATASAPARSCVTRSPQLVGQGRDE